MSEINVQSGPVLIVDDDDSLRRVMEYTLTEAGYRILTAADGEQGLDLFHSVYPAVVITDLQMPRKSGYDVLKEIKKTRPETLVVVITAYGTVDKAVEAMKLGAYDFLTKPFSQDELRLVIANASAFCAMRDENRKLKEKLATRIDFSRIVGTSTAMREVFDVVRRVASSEATVLISGESGTGKELVAAALHHGSERAAEAFIPVNCAAIPAELLESELFGHVKGAFTGAIRDRPGKFELANGGTLFLDEVGELPLVLQPKLLRAIQEREITPVGGMARKVDVRLIAATNRDLATACAEGDFREDLYYRLAVIPLHLPPLRERRDDIPLLVRHFFDKHAKGVTVSISDDALAELCAANWPGNVRELENTIERLLIMRRSDRIERADLSGSRAQSRHKTASTVLNLPDDGFSLEELEKMAVLEALRRNHWNQTRAADFLRIPRHTLIYRIEKYALKRNGEE
ncbi:MAG: sigma-54 dependent transcriptional regulator [Desulfuromonadales bacterium]|nr:sigma-54 dependent transcriptional regulator [Desulfuromonadales bacterium]